MRPLYLVRHALPLVQPDVPSSDWPLSARGLQEARDLASRGVIEAIEALYSSSEPKAQTTALILGEAAGLSVRVVDAFDETRMGGWVGNSDEFNEQVRAMLEGEAAPGHETAEEAARRFEAGLRIVEEGPFPAAIVSHGRVLTAWLSQGGYIESAFEFWRAMPMPGWAKIDLDDPRLRGPFSA